ncbi:hypothetical protein [Deinococcus yavapaiensis]|uniref:DUF3298 domain-containing protein n=1 Tax=Deinococcus yavapaiensis KR-236 TaxID=694435 RepID=A0A318S836_9DEIO|nr:hypothetical protein [Deinococcus yavapaiensis]PYE55177.1 hypothetical protein DES52_1036 [Deinococcus yavapaiensis KR-236]
MRFLALSSVLLVGTSLAAPLGVFSGRVGSFDVVMKLDEPTSDWSVSNSTYFYTSKGLDVPLAYRRSGSNVTVNEYAAFELGADERKATATFRGTLSGDSFRGTWSTTDGKRTLPFTLKRVNVATLPLALPSSPGLLALRAKDPYNFVKVNRAFVVAKRAGDVTWLREPRSGVTYPRLPSGAAVNAALQDRQLQDVQYALSCLSDLSQRSDIDLQEGWEQDVTITYRSATLLSVRSDVGYYCGGAHPDAYIDGLTLNVRTGRALKLTDLWPTLTAKSLDAEYRRGFKQEGEPPCEETLSNRAAVTFEDYRAFLTKDGVTLWPTYVPHVAAPCAVEVTIPFARLGRGGSLAPR